MILRSMYHATAIPLPPDPWLRALRNSLTETFSTHPAITANDADSLAKNATIMPVFTGIVAAFDSHRFKAVIRQMIEQVDVSDDAQLSDLKSQLLAVPEWATDHSDGQP